MKISSISNFFDGTIDQESRPQICFWFCLSLSFAAIYSLIALQQAFQAEYVIADDARQHLFWMQRFIDSGAFPKDIIADYFQSLAPLGYAAFYNFMAVLGISPIIVSKFIPIILCLVTTGYIFGITKQIIRMPIAAFLASLLANQCIWIHDDFASATSRAFLYPLFCAFIYYLLRYSLIGCLVTTILLGLFYPPFVLISAGVTFLYLFEYQIEYQKKIRGTEKGNNFKSLFNYPRKWFFLCFGPLRLTKNPQKYIFYGSILAVSVIALLPSVFKLSAYGSLISVSEARNLPEFFSGGRTSFFNDDNPSRYWFSASRTGFRLAFNPPFLALGLLLPVQLRFPKLFKLAKQVDARIYILLYILIVSCTLFFAAHILLFRLYLPSRYTVHTLRIIFAIASSISIVLLLDMVNGTNKPVSSKYSKSSKSSKKLSTLLTTAVVVVIILYPPLIWKTKFPATSYIVGKHEQLYKFLQKQPFDTLIASISPESSNLPSFAQRSVLVSPEHAIPYHTAYYSQIRQRLGNLVQAQYSPNLDDAKQLIETYGIDWWLLDTNAFEIGYIQNHSFLKQYFTNKFPEDELVKITTQASNILKQIEKQGKKQGEIPALSKLLKCSAYQPKSSKENLILLSTECISKG